ncbi:MAG TPA: HAMP domain-containing sensor histidine kinase [Methylotenera sp.]|nr:HAMP domain-containing sensor histidine kinase [Methylotenera sp.]
MQISYPKSFLKLLLIGFALVMLPLLVAFVNANIYFDRLTKQSLFNMSQAVETTRASRILLEELAVMERSARQYFVLKDKLLLTNYINAHRRFSNAVNGLRKMPMIKPLSPMLEQFSVQENRLFSSVSQVSDTFNYDQTITDAFIDLSAQANKIIKENNQLIDKESALFTAKVARTQRLLFWQTLTLIPLAIIIAGLITWMIARPIRRMDAAINQLGSGNYEQAIKINGPGDLRKLGARLDWLRIALKDLHQQKQHFLQQASHELKTPLTAIREASELLNDGITGKLSEQQTDVIRILRDNSLRLQKMVENLLKYTEIQFASIRLGDSKHDSKNDSKLNGGSQPLKSLLEDILQAYELSIANKKISVEVYADNIFIQKNTEKLRNILDNLISNAVKFTPKHGKITLTANQTKSTLTIAVADTGPGIAENNKYVLFEPFYRGNQLHTGLVSGSGLGLFIAKEAANSLNGVLKLATSEVGAHFILTVPISNLIT